ncbi:MAG TPA: hypothetical protein VG272_01910, partial [Candidatus Acidoferrales bacterium]|nr:hypothetical protein [Candidatus Acidoferrales bacterium]
MNGTPKLGGQRSTGQILLCCCPPLLLVSSIVGCGAVGAGPSQPPSNITVTVAPSTASVLLGEQQTFVATVSNTANTDVIWTANGISGGNATVGTINAGGTYTAPGIILTPPSVNLMATSAADPSKSANATINLTDTFLLSIAGATSVNAGTSATYAATLTPAVNSNPSRVISWSITGTGCAANSCGAITQAGVYTAPAIPPSPATVKIIATPQADPTK